MEAQKPDVIRTNPPHCPPSDYRFRLLSPGKGASPVNTVLDKNYAIPDTAPKGIIQVFMEENPYQAAATVAGVTFLFLGFLRKYKLR